MMRVKHGASSMPRLQGRKKKPRTPTEPINLICYWTPQLELTLPITQLSLKYLEGCCFLPPHPLYTEKSVGDVEEVALSTEQGDSYFNYLLFSLIIPNRRAQSFSFYILIFLKKKNSYTRKFVFTQLFKRSPNANKPMST
jgi:hypothetical protein